MGQTGKNVHNGAVQPDRIATRVRFYTHAKKKRRRKTLTLAACLLAAAFVAIFSLKPASAATRTLLQSFHIAEESPADAASQEPAESIVQFQPMQETAGSGSSEFALRDANALSIVSWQGARNCGDSFNVTLSGVQAEENVRFSATNCTVFPASGTGADSYTITVTGAGAYSLTAIRDGAETDAARDTRTGVAGKADQTPLSVTGWVGAQDYYDTFDIGILGGSTGGAISFKTDGCTVTPTVGSAGTVFTVTVTRVGSYELTAMMDGSANYNSAYSSRMSGCSAKSEQSPIHIDGWLADAACDDEFTIKVYGGSTSEALNVEPLGCEITKLSSNEYSVRITSVGPYAVTATRAGNYGYYTASASVSGVSAKADSPFLSLSGWSETRCCNDSFPIRLSGGVPDAPISFLADGCTVSPASGTVDTAYTVTVTSAGSYSLMAIMDGTAAYESTHTRTFHGTSVKGGQNALNVQNWIDCAPAGSTFEITVEGGSGTGATSVTTDAGCTARLKSGETNVYVVTVSPMAGMDYSVSVGKAGDASYEAAAEKIVSGKTSGMNQTVLAVSGWNESAFSGDSFDIKLSGGSGTGAITMKATGCKITPVGGERTDTYSVTVTARGNEPYSLQIDRAGDANYAPTSIQQTGSVQPFAESKMENPLAPVTATTYGWVYLCGGIVVLFAIVLLLLQFNASVKRRRHHR